MTRLVLGALVLGLLLWAGPARTGSLSDADRGAIEAAIARQIAAFLSDDADTAFRLAAPGIQDRFGTPAGFMSMVREHYAAVYRPRSFSFAELAESGGRVVQKVTVIGPDGAAWSAFYPMERLDDGSWVTGGCVLVRAPDEGA